MAAIENERFSISGDCENTIKRCIEFWLHAEDSKRAMENIRHLSIQDAYEHILHELCMMDDRFYMDFDARNLKRHSTKEDWRKFAVPVIIKMFDNIYWMRNYDEPVDDDYLESDEQSTWINPYTKAVHKIRELSATLIWRAWAKERLWGSRYGVILISMVEKNAEKVLLISHIEGNALHFGFPKGKPNMGETIRVGAFREFKEETGVSDLMWNLHLDEEDGLVIEKNPYIGPINHRRSRSHYYVITTTSVEFTAFQPRKNEVWDIEWHSVYKLPCSNRCQIQRKCRGIMDSDHHHHSAANNGGLQATTMDSDMLINYHMVTLEDVNNEHSAVWDLLECMQNNGNPDARMKYLHTHRRCGNSAS